MHAERAVIAAALLVLPLLLVTIPAQASRASAPGMPGYFVFGGYCNAPWPTGASEVVMPLYYKRAGGGLTERYIFPQVSFDYYVDNPKGWITVRLEEVRIRYFGMNGLTIFNSLVMDYNKEFVRPYIRSDDTLLRFKERLSEALHEVRVADVNGALEVYVDDVWVVTVKYKDRPYSFSFVGSIVPIPPVSKVSCFGGVGFGKPVHIIVPAELYISLGSIYYYDPSQYKFEASLDGQPLEILGVEELAGVWWLRVSLPVVEPGEHRLAITASGGSLEAPVEFTLGLVASNEEGEESWGFWLYAGLGLAVAALALLLFSSRR